MHRSFLCLGTTALAVALLTACGDSQRLADPTPHSPSFRAERFNHFDAFLLGGDPSNPLALQGGFDAGTTAADICADPEGQNLSGEGFALFTPPGGVKTHTSDRDANFVVYEFAGGPVTGPCQLIGAPIVGTGTGKFTFRVSDSGPGAVTIHVTAQGTIDLAGGGQARLLATARVIILPDDSLLLDEERVRLTPL